MVVFLLCVIIAILLFGAEGTVALALLLGALVGVGLLVVANWGVVTDLTTAALLAIGFGFWVYLGFVIVRRLTARIRRKIIPEKATGIMARLRR